MKNIFPNNFENTLRVMFTITSVVSSFFGRMIVTLNDLESMKESIREAGSVTFFGRGEPISVSYVV